jgi:hypothetical protein
MQHHTLPSSHPRHQSQSGRRWSPARINAVFLALAALWFGLLMLTLTPEIDDFAYQWQAAVNLMQSGDPYTATPDYERNAMLFHDPHTGERTVAYVYPPLYAFLLQPLGMVNVQLAQWIWFGVNCSVAIAFIAVCIMTSGSTLARTYWGVVVMAALFAPPMRLSLQLGQVSVILALLTVASFAFAERRAALAGGLAALATMIKLFPGFVALYYLLCRPRRVVGWMLVASVALCALLLPSYGLTPYRAFLNIALHDNYYPYSAEFNISLIGFWDRLFVPGSYAVALADSFVLARALAAVMALFVLGCCLAVARVRPNSTVRLFQFSVWLCALLLLTPANGYYNLVLLVLPVLAIMRYLEERPNLRVRAWLFVALALVCIPPTWTDWNTGLYNTLHTGWGLFLLTPPFYGLLIFLILLTNLTLRCTPSSPRVTD